MSIEIVETPPIRRPKILWEAARICTKSYRRETMLPRLLGASPARVVAFLEAQEVSLEQERQARTGTYSAQAHIEVLSALMAECKKAA